MSLNSKVIVFLVAIFSLFLMLGGVSAVDYNVNSTTSVNDINSWISNQANSGDNLIFKVSDYNLNDTINVKKPINIKSSVNTKINFNSNNHIFSVSTSGVSFSGLTINHNGNGSYGQYSSIVYSEGTTKKVNFQNINFNLNGDYLSGIYISNWEGSFINSQITNSKNDATIIGIFSTNWAGNIDKSSMILNSFSSVGIYTSNWKGSISNSKLNLIGSGIAYCINVGKTWNGNIYNSNMSSKGDLVSSGVLVTNWNGNVSKAKISSIGSMVSNGIYIFETWKGNFIDSSLTLNGYLTSIGIFSKNWDGKLEKADISAKGTAVGFYVYKSKGIISKSRIISKNGIAITVPTSVKIKSTKAVSAKSYSGISYLNTPDLHISKISKKGSTYTAKIYNIGTKSSKSCYFVIKIGKYKKKIKFKALKVGKSKSIKFNLPKKYTNKKYKKSAIIDYYNKFKELNKVNNILNFKF